MKIAVQFRGLLQTVLTLTGLCAAISIQAATITVTGTGDTVAVDGLVTLREAITSINNGANANADVVAVGAYGTNDTINFGIAGSGVHTIAPTASLPSFVKPMLIDGYTQPANGGTAASPNTLAVGDNAVLLIEIDATNASPAFALTTGSNGSTIKGLVINRNPGDAILVQNGSGGNTFSGNFIGTNPAGTSSFGGSTAIDISFSAGNANVIGGTAPAARNVIATSPGGGGAVIDLEGGTGNIVQGNYVGTNAAGTAALGTPSYGITMAQNAVGVLIGGTAAGAGNVIGNFTRSGIDMPNTNQTDNHVIQGNFIGTNATGTATLTPPGVHSGDDGIHATSGTSVTVGGSTAGAGNLISGVTIGISLVGTVGPGWKIQGNKVGTDVTGTLSLRNALCGIYVDSGGGLIGGTNAGEGNIVAFNGTQGVTVGNTFSSGWAILGNSIFSNGGLGISLGGLLGTAGPTANDTCDTDTGANGLQNYPVITALTTGVGTTNIQGTLNSLASSSFRVEFFASPSCNRFGFGEGKTFLGSTTVVTNGSCDGSFNVTVPIGTAGQSITATATLLVNPGLGFQSARPLGIIVPVPFETSEFSQCFVLTPPPTNTPTNTPTGTPTNTPTLIPTNTPTTTPTLTATPTVTATPVPATVTNTPAPVAAIVPTLSPSMLGLLALALTAAALFLVRRR